MAQTAVVDTNGRASDDLFGALKAEPFDPVDFLNATLPSVNLATQSQPKTSRPVQLQTASTEVQTLLSKLNTHNARSSSDLTSLTDEILRSGNRLAYEVEVLRGDINSFYELLTETLKDDIRQFVRDEAVNGVGGGESEQAKVEQPAFINQLRTLGQVKARLESVVAVFGEAMKWSVPPSDLSMGTSLISVSAPELGVQNTEEDDKARESAKAIRAEVQDLLEPDGGGYAGLEAATKRVAQYKDLVSIWKGTAEEKVRVRFVESLIKMLDDRKRVLDSRNVSARGQMEYSQRSSSTQGRSSRTDGGGGLFRNLARLKDDLYLD
jgi:hypothetical protein